MDMSLISGMPEVIAYIRSQDERIKALTEENELLDKQRVLDIERMMKGDEYKAENEKLKNTIVSLKSSVDDLREARDMRDHQIEKLKKFKSDVIDALQFDDDLDDEDYISSIKEMEEQYDINR